MDFVSIRFAAFVIVAVCLLNLVVRRTARLGIVLALSLVFAAAFVSSPLQLLPLAAFVVLGYGAVRLAARTSSGGLLMLVCAVVALFVWLKQYSFVAALPGLGFVYATIGLSYMLFRIIHLMVDVQQGSQRAPTALEYLAYLTFFLTLVSGPIQRFEDFERQISSPALPHGFDTVDRAFRRIVLGLLLVGVVTVATEWLFHRFELRFLALLAEPHHGARLFLFYTGAVIAFAVHLYLNFSGYMEMVIGIGMLCGFTLPENFDRPYKAENFLDFWSRWHMTLSNWFKFYLFNPLLKVLARRFGKGIDVAYLSAIAFVVTFGVMGVWHGSTSVYVWYGVLLGLGAAGNKVYQVEMARRLGKTRYKALRQRVWYRSLSRGMALAYFAVAITAMWIAPQAHFESATGLALLAFAFVSISLIAMAADLAFGLASKIVRRPAAMIAPPWARPVITGGWLFVVILLVVVVGAGKTPEFIYKAF